MKKTAIVLLAILASVILIFTACNKDGKDKDMLTTTSPVTTTEAARTTERLTAPVMTDDASNNAGAPESTKKDSALADAVEGAADGVADANERIADGVRNAQNNNR